MEFKDLQVKEEILKAIGDLGFSELTEIQEKVIPIALDYHDLIGQAPTGTGKTYIAFQICWKLMQTRWNNLQNGKLPKILFIADRNILADQAFNAFGAFDHHLVHPAPQEAGSVCELF